MYDKASSNLIIDNKDVRVMKWSFDPSQSTGLHKHEYDYVVVPCKTGQSHIITENEKITSDLVIHEPYHRKKGIEHEVVYNGNSCMEFIEIEIKS
jgi:quercetin dioxygenase-like cupin family protein